MLPHDHVKRLLNTLTGDPETIATIAAYIDDQASLEAWDHATTGRVAAAADRRSHEASARTITLDRRITDLEDSNRDLTALLGELMEMMGRD
jgi:hypothetical protein